MRISYDSEVDALYIRLLEGSHECRTVRLSEEVALNMGKGESLVGIEILDARRSLARERSLRSLSKTSPRHSSLGANPISRSASSGESLRSPKHGKLRREA